MEVERTGNRDTLLRLGVAFGLVAAGLAVLATFLARLSCPTIQLHHNRLIERDEVALFFLCAGAMIVGAIACLKDRRGGWLLVLAGLAIIGLTIYSATGSRSLLLPSIPGIEDAVHGEFGSGLVLSGFAGVMAAGAGVLILTVE